MTDLAIVCPTHGRAGRVRTHEVVTDLILCVAESQAGFYREAYPQVELEVHPDDVVGLAPKRQWISERFGDVFMFDDDIKRVADLTSFPGEPYAVIPPARVREHVEQLHAMTAELGIYLFSFSSNCDTRFYRAQSPFSLQGYCPGHCFGLRKGSELWWHPGMKTMEDWWISALNAHYHRMILRDDRIGVSQADTFRNPGGQSSHRTHDRERESFAILKEHFGSAIGKRSDKSAHTRGKATELRAAHPYQPQAAWAM